MAARQGGVDLDLSLQGVDAVELALVAQKMRERDAKVPIIKTFRQVEQMHFQHRALTVEGGAPPVVGDAVENAGIAFDPRPDRIDSGARAQGVGQMDVGGGEADGASPRLAVFDPALDRPVAAEDGGCVLAAAFADRVAGGGGRQDHPGAAGHRGEFGDAEAARRSGALQRFRGAGAALAEGVVVADDDVADVQAAHQGVGDEVVGGGLRIGEVEPPHEQEVRAHVLDQLRLDAERGEAEGGEFGLEGRSRVRLEGQDAEGPGLGAGERQTGRDHRLVAAMHAVEIADGDDPLADIRRDVVGMTQDQHAVSSEIPPAA